MLGRIGVAVLLCAALAAPAAHAAGPKVEFARFDAAAIRRALDGDRLVLLVLDVPWSGFARRADQELWTDPAIVAALAEGFVAVRERADLRP
ncbi:MAG: hypothetical protein D6738_10920, partial [Acidobacteria bacterium]